MRKTLLALGLFFMLLGAGYVLKAYYGVDLIKGGHPVGFLGSLAKSLDVTDLSEGRYAWRFGWDRMGRFTVRRWAQQQHLLTAYIEEGGLMVLYRSAGLWSIDDRKTLRVKPGQRIRWSAEVDLRRADGSAAVGFTLLTEDLRKVIDWSHESQELSVSKRTYGGEFIVPAGSGGLRCRVYGKGDARVLISKFEVSVAR